MRWMVPMLCFALVAFAQETDKKPCDGCAGGADKASAQICPDAVAVVTKVRAAGDDAAAAKVLLASIPNLKCEQTAGKIAAKIRANTDDKACAELVMHVTKKLAAKTCDAGACDKAAAKTCDAGACGDKAGKASASCDEACAAKAGKLVAAIKSTEDNAACVKLLVTGIDGFKCEKSAAALVEKIKSTPCPQACAKMVMDTVAACSKANAICPTSMKIASAIRVMTSDEAAVSVLTAEIKGLNCKIMAGKLVAGIRKAESDEAAAKIMMECARQCASGSCDKAEGCGDKSSTDAKKQCPITGATGEGCGEAKKADAPKGTN